MLKRILFVAVVIIAFIAGLSVNLRKARAETNVRVLRVHEKPVAADGDVIGFSCLASNDVPECFALIR